MTLLQAIAQAMAATHPSLGQSNPDDSDLRLVIHREALLAFLRQKSIFWDEEVDPDDWLQQMLDVSELLVEREREEYEFPHASFQGFFAAIQLAQSPDQTMAQQQILQNWNEAIWRETVLFYTAQLKLKPLNHILRQASALNSEAAQLAAICLKEYPRPDKVDPDLKALLEDLETVTQNSTYQKLEELLKVGQWREADQETYRLMITNPAVGKEEDQWFDCKDLEEFPCEDLRILDQLWVKYSNGKFGFSVQKQIWQECGSPMTMGKAWDEFCVKVGWQDPTASRYMSSHELKYDLTFSPTGELPFRLVWVRWGGWSWILIGRCLFSRAETCKL